MRDFGRRLKTIEKRLIPRKKVRIGPPIISGCSGRTPTPEDEEKLGPIRSWITYKRQLQAQEKANDEYLKDHPGGLGHVIIIEVDVDKEYQARQGVQAND